MRFRARSGFEDLLQLISYPSEDHSPGFLGDCVVILSNLEARFIDDVEWDQNRPFRMKFWYMLQHGWALQTSLLVK